MPVIAQDTYATPGGHRYRIYVDGVLRMTSGGFLLQRDAQHNGHHIATDPDVLHYLKD